MVKTFKDNIRKFSPKLYWKELLAVLVVLLAFVFFRNERKELSTIMPQLRAADGKWIFVGVGITALYIFLQGFMYVFSFKAIGLKIKITDAIELFLKRNFLSVFLPAGGVSALAYTTSQLRKQRMNQVQIHQASALYGYIGLLTVFLIGVPVILYTMLQHSSNVANASLSLFVLGAILLLFFLLVWSFQRRKGVYLWLNKRFPGTTTGIENVLSAKVNRKYIIYTVITSTLIEFCGITHVFISMYALGLLHSFEAAVVGYTISVVLMIVSPFLRGLGAVEFSMLLIFKNYGYSDAHALGITLLYRIFEFWLPLFMGVISFMWRGKEIITRLLPAALIFVLGVVNVISVLTPPVADRLRLDRFYLPVEAIHASKLMVLMLGLGLLVTSAYLLKGYRAAYWVALVSCIFSLFGHLAKALDYEESIIALVTIAMLWMNRKQYRIKSSAEWLRIGFFTFFIALLGICIFDFLSFYFIDKRHFGVDFTWEQSIYHTGRSFLLFTDDELQPQTLFGVEFLRITQVLGLFSWLLLMFALVRPRLFRQHETSTYTVNKAKEVLEKYGQSALDYFKISSDKLIFFSENEEGFVAYRIANTIAVVLEDPVCDPEDKESVLMEFEAFCYSNGFKPVYYRVSEDALISFSALKKKKIVIGQEAILEVSSFKLEGKERKSLRNGLNSLEKKGYSTAICYAPLSETLVKELQQVSDNWLLAFDKKESIFSQGMFDAESIATQDVILVKDEHNTIVSFLNIIPDYAAGECTYDLIRKTEDAPGGSMDALMVKLVDYAREKNYSYINLGLVPMVTEDTPDGAVERILQFVAKNISGFKHYRTLREFKDKYATLWENKYLLFDNDFDLINLPAALNKVVKPLP